ncbi:MAG: hypothetical protein KatS3mg111_0472 [Pirellulaceae bacterium]|nr:MAG: hypothetical protein KatS3mg111_0472 [Pirellulaceae bacterium]
MTVADQAEGISLVVNPSEASELGDPKAVYHLTPTVGTSFKTGVSIQWEVQLPDPAADSTLAEFGADYTLADEDTSSGLSFGSPDTQFVVASNLRDVGGDDDFQLTVTGINDGILEGDEQAPVRVFVPALIPAGDPTDDSDARTAFNEATITEEYLNTRTEKDEQAGCSCTCTTCSDGLAIELSSAEGTATITTADGMVMITTSGQDGVHPVTYVGLPLPSGKAVPDTITAKVQVIDKWVDGSGQPIGLGRKLVDQHAIVSPVVSFEVPSSATPGDVLWFSIQADLSAHVEAWTRQSGQSEGSDGVLAKIVPLELLVNASFAATVPPADRFSGWVGQTNHVVRADGASSLGSQFGGNTSVAGVDRMIRDTEIIVPDDPGDGSPTGGKVKYATGTMLVRADGGTSWFDNGTGQAPGSHDTLNGDFLIDRYGNKKRFNQQGDMIEYQDAAGNAVSYSYVTSGTNQGAVASITDQRGQQTTFTYTTDSSGHPRVDIRTVNSGGASDRLRSLTWKPIDIQGGKLTVDYADPDGPGPRLARQDVFHYNNAGALVKIESGEVGAPTHTTTIDYDVTYVNQGGWLIPQSGSRRLAKITYPDGSSTTLDLVRQTNALVDALFDGGVIWTTDPRALRIGTAGGPNPIPDYAVTTHQRSGSADLQRTILQLDHRGRVVRYWDPEQVAALGLETGPIDENDFSTLQANVALSHEYVREPTQRNGLGQVTGDDHGEILQYITPQQYAGGPRQTTSWTYDGGSNPVTQQRPIQSQETFTWDDAFDVLTEAVDATGNRFTQQVDSLGRVTQQTWYQGQGPQWQNPVWPVDVNDDGYLSPIDALLIINYLNQTGGGHVSTIPGSPPPYYDVNGDDYVSSVDALIVQYALDTGGPGPAPTPPKTIGNVTYEYVNDPGLPNDLVSTMTITTGRQSGGNPDNSVLTYSYYNIPSQPAKHARLYRITTADGAYTELDYDDRGNVASVQDPAGRVTKMWYDNRDRLIARMSPDPDGSGPLLPTLERFDYDVFDNLIATEVVNSWVDPAGILRVTGLKTSYQYDAGNRLTKVVTQDPGLQWYFTSAMASQTSTPPTSSPTITVGDLEAYAAANAPIANLPENDPNWQGLVTEYAYFNTLNTITRTESDAGNDPRQWKHTVDRLGRITKTVTPDPGAGTFYVSGQQTEGGGYVTTFDYDFLDNLTTVTDPLGRVTSYSYDSLNRVTAIDEPGPYAGQVYQTLIDYTEANDGWLITVTNPAGESVATQLDPLGRVLSLSGDTHSVQYAYWTDGALQAVTDAHGNMTNFEYDNRGRLTAIKQPPEIVGWPGRQPPTATRGTTMIWSMRSPIPWDARPRSTTTRPAD